MTTTRWWVSALLIFFLQTVVLPFWWQAEVRPDLWLVAVALITLFYGPRHGIWVAALAGVIADVLAANFFGPHLAGYLLLVLPLWLAWSRFQIRWEMSFLAVLVASLFAALVYYCIWWLGGIPINITRSFLGVALPQVLLNALLALALHPLLRPRRQGD